MHNPRDAKPTAVAQPSPAEERIALAVERITIAGVELSPLDSQRFEAMLIAELQRRLIEQFSIDNTNLEAETLRFDLSEIVLDLDQPGDLNATVGEVARRLALTLESAVRKGAS
jgi:hypothetical protein